VLSGAAAERVLDRFLRAHRDLTASARQAAAEAIFGVGLWRRRLRFHAGEDAPPLLLLASLLRDLAGREDAEGICGLAGGSLPRPVAPPPDLATFYSLPAWLAATLEREARASFTFG
jgi:16S rRNA (cytosine967-C5)-methyltransferase